MKTMIQPETTQEWAKPELVVLVRNKPEDAVLEQCKAEHEDVWYSCQTCKGQGRAAS